MDNKELTFKELAEKVLTQTKIPMTVNEIWEYGEKLELTKKVKSQGKTPTQTLGARLYLDIKNNDESLFEIVSKRPTRFGIKNHSNNINKTIINKDCNEEKYNERDLHILLSSFVYSNEDFSCLTKTIFHEKTPKNKKGSNEWIHPDIVGVHFADDDYSESTIKLQEKLGYKKDKIYSFEMKKNLDLSNLRECYFQAVSNSSWANEGYLVTFKISNEEYFMSELRRLNNAFGIGIIQLNPENISQSKVLFPSRISENLDWETIDRLADNPDFKKFLEDIPNSNRSNKLIKLYDDVLDEEECRFYAKKKHII